MSDSLYPDLEQLLSAYFHQDWGDDQESETDVLANYLQSTWRGRSHADNRADRAVSARSPDKPARGLRTDFTPMISIGTNDEEARTWLADTCDLLRSGVPRRRFVPGRRAESFQPRSGRADERSGIRRVLPVESTAGQRHYPSQPECAVRFFPMDSPRRPCASAAVADRVHGFRRPHGELMALQIVAPINDQLADVIVRANGLWIEMKSGILCLKVQWTGLEAGRWGALFRWKKATSSGATNIFRMRIPVHQMADSGSRSNS